MWYTETNIILYINYISIKTEGREKGDRQSVMRGCTLRVRSSRAAWPRDGLRVTKGSPLFPGDHKHRIGSS